MHTRSIDAVVLQHPLASGMREHFPAGAFCSGNRETRMGCVEHFLHAVVVPTVAGSPIWRVGPFAPTGPLAYQYPPRRTSFGSTEYLCNTECSALTMTWLARVFLFLWPTPPPLCPETKTTSTIGTPLPPPLCCFCSDFVKLESVVTPSEEVCLFKIFVQKFFTHFFVTAQSFLSKFKQFYQNILTFVKRYPVLLHSFSSVNFSLFVKKTISESNSKNVSL